METIVKGRKQTAFRLRKDLIERLKKGAKEENRSLNNYVENLLLESVYRAPNDETLSAMKEEKMSKVETSSYKSFLKSLE